MPPIVMTFSKTSYTLLVLIFAGTNFRGDRIDHISQVLIFADLPNQDISRIVDESFLSSPSKKPKNLKSKEI